MNGQLRVLRELQQVNDKIRELEDEKAAMLAALEARRKDTDIHGQSIDDLNRKIIEAKKDEDRYILDLKSNEADINKLLGHLVKAKTNEEYSGLNKRIENEREQNSALEDSILAIMTDVEEMEKQVALSKRQAESEEKEISAFEAKVTGDCAALNARIEQNRNKAAEIGRGIEKDVLDKYYRLYERKDGDALAALDCHAAICLGCNLPVTRQDVNLVLAADKIIFCKSCGRILYILDEDSQSSE